MEEIKNRRQYYLSNRDLLIIAVLSGIGGVMSTYVGYLGNLINQILVYPSVPGSLPLVCMFSGLFWQQD